MSKIYSAIKNHAEHMPSHKAFTYRAGEQYESIDYRTLREYVDSLAAHLVRYKGKTVAIIGNNKLEYAVCLLTVLSHIGNALLIDKELGEDDIESVFEHVCPELILLDNELNLSFEAHEVMLFSEVCDKMKEKTGFTEDPSFAGDLILHTSGTTGQPKCVLLQEKNYYSVIPELNRKWGVKPEHSCLFIIPLYHIYALTSLFHGLYVGIENIIEWDYKRIGKVLSETKPRLFMGVPLMYNRIMEVAFGKAGRKLFAALFVSNLLLKIRIDVRSVWFREIHEYFGGNYIFGVSAGSVLPYRTSRFFNDIGLPVYNVYGMTETAGPVAINYMDHNRYDSVGEILDNNEVRIEEPDADGIGRVCVRGRNVFRGYLGERGRAPIAGEAGNAADAGDNTATGDNAAVGDNATVGNFFDTGDLGYIKDHFLYIIGRRKNILIGENGKNISPEELNQKLLENNRIHDCSVIMEDGKLIAVVNTDLAAQEMRRYLDKVNHKLPGYKRISGFRTTDKMIRRQGDGTEVRGSQIKS